MLARERSRVVRIGNLRIGGGNPVAIQSMCNTKTTDVAATVGQIMRLQAAGCEIVRLAVPDQAAARAFSEIRKEVSLPMVADIHFDYRLAIAAIEGGADKIRINPGNIGGAEKLRAVVDCAREREVPIRVGVNSGSLEKQYLEKYGGHVTAEGLAESALDKAAFIEGMGYRNLVLSIKSSDVLMSDRAYGIAAERTDCPLHIGITEAGTLWAGNIKSALGLGMILSKGIGDTVRVSLTADPVEEVRTAKLILRTLGLRQDGISVVSCPTCGRTNIDLIGLANAVEEMLAKYELPAGRACKVAVMGCAVNGPGEAREADIGIAGGNGEGILFKKGEIVRKVPEEGLLEALREELPALLEL